MLGLLRHLGYREAEPTVEGELESFKVTSKIVFRYDKSDWINAR
jgi:hypothetical protein